MDINKFGQQILSSVDLCDAYLSNPDVKIKRALVSENITFDDALNLEDTPSLTEFIEPDMSLEEFDTMQQSQWFMPEEYKSMDIAKWVLDQCKEDHELQRAGEELIEFQKRDMFLLLRYCKYLVDTMRENKVVWGVGRGSSVSSYVLYLIGIHRINSLHMDLSIDEFLK
jgi:hypothetical protein